MKIISFSASSASFCSLDFLFTSSLRSTGRSGTRSGVTTTRGRSGALSGVATTLSTLSRLPRQRSLASRAASRFLWNSARTAAAVSCVGLKLGAKG